MSNHPKSEALLGHLYGLLEGEEAETVRQHVESCEQCRDEEARLENAEGELLPERPAPPSAPSLGATLVSSTAPPIVAMAIAWGGAALLPPEGAEAASLALLLAGGIAVVAWLHAVVAQGERSFRQVEGHRWPSSTTDDDHARLDAGVALSVAHGLRMARTRISRVLVAALCLALVGGGAILLAGQLAPGLTGEVTSRRPMLLPGALTAGVLLAGALWSGLRLTRLARSAALWTRRRLEAR